MRYSRLILALLCLATAIPGPAWDHKDEGQLVVRRGQTNDLGGNGAVFAFCGLPNGEVIVGADRLYLNKESVYRAPIMSAPVTSGFRALSAASENKIWVGAVNELGYLTQNDTGEYIYSSLLAAFKTANPARPSPGEIQAVLAHGTEGAFFLGEKAVHFWDGKTFQTWSIVTRSALQPLQPSPGRLWYYQRSAGIFSVTRNGPRLLLADEALPGPIIWVLPPATPNEVDYSLSQDGWLVGTSSAVFIRYRGEWQQLPEISRELKGSRPTTATALSDGYLAIGTQNKGVLVASREGRVISRLDGDNTLGDNQVFSMWADPRGDLWVGTAIGWARVVPPQRYTTVPPADGKVGVANNIRGLVRLNESTYIATGRGVFMVQPGMGPEGGARLAPLPTTPGPVWSLATRNGLLVAGGVEGIWEWNGNVWRTLRTVKGDVMNTLASRIYPGRIYYTIGKNLYVLDENAVSPPGLPLDDSPAFLLEDTEGSVWVSTAQKGLRHFVVTPGGLTADATFAPATSGLPEELKRPFLTRIGDRVILFTDVDILQFNRARNAFEHVPAFENFRGIAASAPMLDGRCVWSLERMEAPVIRQAFLADIALDPDGNWKITPLNHDGTNYLGRIDFLLASERASDPAIWTASTRILSRYGPEIFMPAAKPPTPTLSGIVMTLPGKEKPTKNPAAKKKSNTGEDNSITERLPLHAPRKALPSNLQRLRFELGVATNTEAYFQTQLVGLESGWSQASTYYLKDFAGLAAGQYEFRVRTVDRMGNVGPTIAYAFSREYAWYLRWPAWLAYSLMLIGLIAFGMRWRLRNLSRQNERLNHMVSARTRELAMANSAKMEFLASISHEIRNPLNGITGLVTLLNDAHLAPRERDLARSLAACSRSLRRVFDEVLGFARLEEGRISVHEIAFHLHPLLDDVAKVFAAEAAQRHCSISVKLAEKIPALQGDAEKIRTIVSNFAANALKYAPGAPIEIEATVEQTATQHAELTIQVHDHGPGIPPEEQELIFRKFVRGSGAELHREPGAGLGLATCQALAKLMGGGVGVESKSGQGSTFYLQLTLRLATEEPAAPGHENSPVGEPELASPVVRRALVIEDHQYNQLVARSILERLNYTVEVAANASEARVAIEAGGYDLALVDWDVPGAKGDELAPLIRAQPEGAAVTVLAVTAHDAEEIRERCLASGMDGFLVKPLDEELLLHTLRSLRERRQTTGKPAASVDQTKPDFSIFSYLGRGDDTQARAAATDYVEQLDAELAALDHAIKDQDATQIAAFTHRLRAHAAVVHFHALREATKILQERVSRQSPDTLQREIADVLQQAAILRELLHRHLAAK
ncbi:ATP-binding protein [Oleiharenicola lentus]|uniref:ATP-binding protein n=1 Tax=Oleiharenicola lentus TaxID=2508720 RepID=UPI003F670F17